MTPELFGAASGFLLQWFSNSVRKLPLTRRPWEIPLAMGVTAYAFSYFDGITMDAHQRIETYMDSKLKTEKTE
eukprot:JP448799.1.p1 GENE.JP448799.1~~JP448799.1.p1  ORF type:complete len:73 (+),score=15.33 JP448799.1:25-243(+)